MLKDDGRDLVERFRDVGARRRPPVRIQRWSLRRLGLTATVLVGALLFLGLVISNWTAFA